MRVPHRHEPQARAGATRLDKDHNNPCGLK